MSKYNQALGAALRAVRSSQNLSLGQVAVKTDGEFKTSVLGAYERGERAMTVERLSRLCSVYGVRPTSVLPRTDTPPISA